VSQLIQDVDFRVKISSFKSERQRTEADDGNRRDDSDMAKVVSLRIFRLQQETRNGGCQVTAVRTEIMTQIYHRRG